LGRRERVGVTDNATFKQAGAVFGPARYGVLSAIFASGSDPDTTHTCSVDLTVSQGELHGRGAARRRQFLDVVFRGRRAHRVRDGGADGGVQVRPQGLHPAGLYNTPVGSHAVSSRFARCDSALFRYGLHPAFIGKTIYLKFASFNAFGGGGQDLANVTSYPYAIAGPIG